MKYQSMPLRAAALAAILATSTSAHLQAHDSTTKTADPLAGAFFPPELVLLARDQIELTAQQRTALLDQMKKMESQSAEIRAKLEREAAALAVIAKQDRVEEQALLAQLDKVLDAEREAKRLRVGLLVAVKNLLTPKQQAQLRPIAESEGARIAEDLRQRLTKKVDRVQEIAREWAENGRDQSPIAKAMEEKVKPLLDSGKALEADAVLDHLLEELQQKPNE